MPGPRALGPTGELLDSTGTANERLRAWVPPYVERDASLPTVRTVFYAVNIRVIRIRRISLGACNAAIVYSCPVSEPVSERRYSHGHAASEVRAAGGAGTAAT